MKKFTLIFTILFIAILASGQNYQSLQERIENAKTKISRNYMSKSHLLKSGSTSLQSLPKDVFLKSTNAIQKLDSVVYQDYNAGGDTWQNTLKDAYQYDSELKNTVWYEQEWDSISDVWQNISKIELEFNENGQVSVMDNYFEDETTGELVLETKTRAYYSPEGRLDSVQHYAPQDADSWIIEAKQVYHYNESGQLVQMDIITWEEDDEGQYMQQINYVYTYDNEGRMQKSSIYYLEGEIEILYSETEMIYDVSGRRTSTEYSGLNFLTFTLQPEFRMEYEYNAMGDVSVETTLLWNAGTETWVEDGKNEYTYTDTSFSETIFPSYLQIWGINEESNEFNHVVSTINSHIMIEGEWELSDRSIFYYSDATPTSTTKITEVQVSVYPNPATDNITITWNGYNLLLFEVYSITGAKVIEKQVTSGMQVPVSQLNDGVFLFKLITNNKTLYSGKLIKR